MADYSVVIEGKLSGFDKLNDIEKQINNLNGKQIDINLNIPSSTLNNILTNRNISIVRNTGQQIGEIMSQETASALRTGITSKRINVPFNYSYDGSDKFESAVSKEIAEIQKKNNTAVQVKYSTQLVDEPSQDIYGNTIFKQVEKLRGASFKYQTEAGETILKNMRWGQVGLDDDNNPIMGFVQGLTTYSKTLDNTSSKVDNFVKKQKTAYSNLENTYNQLRRNAEDKNSSRPITSDESLSKLSDEKVKVEQALSDLKNSNADTFDDAQIAAKTAITNFKSLTRELRNADNIKPTFNSTDLETGKEIASNKLEKLSTYTKQFPELESDIEKLRTEFANIGDTESLNKFNNSLKVTSSRLGALKADAQAINRENQESNRSEQLGIKKSVANEKLNTYERIDSRINDHEANINGKQVTMSSLRSDLGNVGTLADMSTFNQQLNAFVTSAQNAGIQVKESLNQAFNFSEFDNLQARLATVKDSITSAGATNLGADNYQQMTAWVNQADQAVARLNAEIAKGESANFSNLKSDMKELSSLTDKAANSYARLAEENIGMVKQSNTLKQLKSYWNNNSKAWNKYGGEYQKILSSLSGDNLTKGQFAAVQEQIASMKTSISADGLGGSSVFTDAKRAFGQIAQFATMYGIIQRAIMEFPRQVVSAVTEVDTAMTNLYKVTDETASRYESFLGSSGSVAKSLGRSMSSYITQVSEWSKLGYNFNESQELAKTSSIYANIGEVSDTTAVSDMITAMKAYNIEASNSVSIIDRLNILGNEFATSSSALGEGLSNSASALAEAGNDIDQSLAMLTGMSEITQSASESGNALKIMSMRVRGYSEETQSYSEDVEELDGKIASFTKTAKTPGGISLFTDETKQTYKSTYELLKEISEIYDDLTDREQAKLLENLAGKNRGNQIAALLQAFQSGQVEKAYQASTHSDGSAQKEQERWLNSIEAKTQQFKAQFQDFSNSLVSSNFIKGIVDIGTEALTILTTLIDKLGTIQTLIVGITAFKGIKSLVSSFSQLQQIGQVITAFKAGNDVTAVLKSFGSLNQAGEILRKVNIDGMNKVSLLQSAFGSTEEMATTALGIRAVGDASTASSVGIFGLSNAFKGLASSLGISSLALGGIVAAIAAVTAGFSAYQAYKANIEKQDQTAKESAQEWSSKKESLEEYKAQIEELGSSLESGNLTEQEAYNAKSQLLDIQKSLTESYGELSSGIDLVNGDYKKQLELVNKISVAEANRKLAKNESAYKRSEKEMNKERTYDLGNLNYIDGVKNSDANVKLFNLAKSFEDKGITLDKRTGSMGLKLGYTIKFTGDASEAEEVITDFSTKVRELQTDFNTNEDNTGSIFAEQILKSSEKALSDNDKTLEKYRDTYNEFLEMDLYNQGLEKGKPASVLNDYTDAIEKYNEALESGDSSKIQEASTSFDEVQKSVDGVLSKYPRFQSIFDDAKDQLNTSAISSRDLNKVLTSSSDELKSNTFVADGLTEKQSKKLMKSYQDYQNVLDEMNELGIDSSQTKFGNIDTNNRQVLKWTDENLQTYKEALQSWDEEAAQDFDSYAKDIKNSISTVFGSSAEFDGVEIAFSPMLQTDHGAELLDADTVYDYIYALIEDAGEGWTFDQLLELDSKGLEFNGKTIKNLIADIGDTAIQTGEAMHYLGKDGALNDSYNRFSKKAKKYGTSADEFISEYKNYESPYKKFKDTANILKGLNLSDIDLKNAIDTDGLQKGEVALRNLIPLAKELGLIDEDLSDEDSLSAICDSLVEAGIVSDGTSESIKNLRNSFTALESASDSVLSSITSVNNVLSSQQTGFSIDYGDFTSEDLTDYQTALEYVNGSLQLNAEKVKEISKAKADEQIASNDAAKAAAQADYLKNANEIDTLTASLAGLEETSSEYASIQNQIASLQSDNDEIALKCSQYDLLSQSIREANGEYQAWLDSQKASDYGDMFSDSLNAYDQIVNTFDPESDIYGNFGSKKFDAAIDMIVPDSVDRDDLEAVQNYMNDFKKYLTFDKDGKADGMNIEKFCQDAMDKGLMVIDESSGEYKVAGEKTMKDFEEGLNLSSAAVTSFFDQMLLKGAEFDWADEANKTLGDLGLSAAKAKQALQSIDGNENLKINIYTDDIDSSEEKIKTLNDTISEMQNLKANPEIDTESAERANEIIRYCVAQEQLLSQPIVMSVDASNASEDVQNAISSLQQFQQAKNELDVQIALKGDTTEAQAAVDEALSNIQGQAEIMAVLGIEDTSSVDKVIEGLQNQQPEILAKFGVKTDDVTSKVDEINNKKLEPKNTTLTALDYATPVIQGVIDALDKVQSKEVELKVTTNHVDTNSSSSSGSKKGTGSVSGTAHARGTAKLNGDWGLKSTKRVLIGELGREIVVDPHTGTWRTYGDNGAEFATIPKDAIVFNNAQSEDLLKNGYVSSRATALMKGTAFAADMLIPPVTNAFPDAKASTINDHGSDAKSTKENTKAKDANTKATKKNTNVFDGVARKLKYFSNKTKAIADTITDYITSAFKEIQLQRQIKSIDKEVSVNKKGEQAYLRKANSLTLSDDWKRRIRSGDYNIDDVTDDTLYKTIQKYQDYYDKATSCKQAVVDLRNQQLKLFEDLMNIPTEKAEKKIEKLSKKYDMLSASQNAAMVGESTSSKLYSLQNNTYSSASANKKKSKKSLKKANKAIKKTKSKLTKSQKKDAGKGNSLISTKGLKGKELKNAQAYNNAVKKQRKLKTNDETNSILLSYYSQDFPNLSDYTNEPSYEYANDILDKQLKNERQQNKARQEAYKKSTSNLVKIRKTKNNADKNESKARKKIKKDADLMKKLSKSQKKNLNSGKKVSTKGLSSKQKQKIKAYNKAVTKSDKIDQKYNIAYNAQQTSAKNAAESQSELAQKIVQNELDKFDNIKNFYDAKIDYQQSLTDTVDKQVELSEAHGNYITQKDYRSKISSRKTTKALNEEKLKNLEQQLASSVKSGVIKEGSTEWLQLKTEIAETANEIQSCTVDIENLNQESIKAKYEEMFDRVIDKAQQFIDKLDTINSIITDDMKFDDNGKLTDLGALSMVLNANQMNTELSNLQKYIQKRQKIILDYKAEMFGEESYNEQMKENDSNMQSSLKNLNSYRTAILDMVKEQSKTELDALNKVMDARKKALQKKKDYYDYDKQLKDKNKEIALLQQQIRALDGVTDAESKARKAKLEADLKEKQNDLSDTIRDHVYELQVTGIDDLKDALQEDYDKYVKELAQNLDKMTEAISLKLSLHLLYQQ